MACTVYAAHHTKDSPTEVKKALGDRKAVLIDVREADEWNDGHFKGAKHLALSDLTAGVPDEKLGSSGIRILAVS